MSTSSHSLHLQGSTTSPAGYYLNGTYYGTTAPTAPAGWPYTSSPSYYYSPVSTSPLTYYNYSQAYPYSAYSGYNYSQYSTAPQPFAFPAASPWATSPWAPAAPSPWATSPWAGAAAQAAAAVAANAAIAQLPSSPYYFVGSSAAEIQAQNAMIAAQWMAMGQPKPPPNQLVPYKPGNTPQFWCKELDGSWTLRELSDFTSGDLTAGRWEVHPTSGYHYFVRAAA